MGYDRNRLNTGLLALRVESGRMLTPASVAGMIQNFEATPQGTLRSVHGPAPVLPDYPSGQGPVVFNYGRAHGVFHALLMEGTRDVLLAHMGDTIWVFEGWSRTWRALIGPSGSGAQLIADIPDTTQPQYPTQFEQTPTGIVIVPQNRSRAYFYDGEVVLPLGYDKTPPAPFGYGTGSFYDTTGSPTSGDLPNYYGYTASGGGIPFGHNDFGYGEVGYVIPDSTGNVAATIGHSHYQAAVQWVDYFGNLSPLSARSNTVTIDQEIVQLNTGGVNRYLHAFYWAHIIKGPEGTIGRVFCHTKDLLNSGSSDIYEVPGNMIGATTGSYATIPDNTTREYHYNRPDSELVTQPKYPIPVPLFKVCAVAFGRLWIAGIEGDPGVLIPSMPGRWGTFLRDSEYYPDPKGAEITALCAVREGLLVFTTMSTFLVVASDDGLNFKAMPLSNIVGCVAPSSIATLQDDSTIWLARDGFYRFQSSKGVQNISLDIEDMVKRVNPGRAKQACALVDPRSREYRCWVPLDGGRENDFCFIFDPISEGWRRRVGTEAPVAACLTRDHRVYPIMAGRVTDSTETTKNGVWVLDHQVSSYTPKARIARLETSWIEAARSKEVKSGKLVYLWLRETRNSSATIEVYRDWRETATVYTDSVNADLVDPEDVPALWGTTVYGQTTGPNVWIKRRPYWKKVSIFVPSCEVYKIVVRSTQFIEIIGLSMDELPHGGSGRVP